jgi:hypothetical protein
MWVVKTCECGGGNGDREDEFETMGEAKRWVESQRTGDGSIMDVIDPDGEALPARRNRMFPQYADEIIWPEGD